ncbi:MAG: hypothetical protein QXT26_01045 [Thermoproteota archaeon]
MPHRESRALLDAEVLVKLAYLTISEDVDLKSLETLRFSYGQGSNTNISNEVIESTLELTPLEELRRFCEQALEASKKSIEED